MKIGLLIYGTLDTLSGGYLYDRMLVEYLRAQGDEVQVISLPWRNYAAHLGDNLSFRLPSRIDVLIQDELNHPSLLAANAGLHACPVISLVHHLRCSEQRPGWQNFFYRLVEKAYLRSVDGFIFNSRTTQTVVEKLAGSGKPHLVAYPPTDRFGKALAEEVVRLRAEEAGALRIAFLGNVIPRKGLSTLLDAIAASPAELQLDVIGSLAADPAYAAGMRQKGVKLGGKVTFHGPLENAALAGKLANAHLLVVPSSYEGFGIVYLEGMAFGLPAIGTNSGAAAEIISDGSTGFLVGPGDSQTLAHRLTDLAENRAELQRMSLNALQRYRKQPAWEETAGEIRRFLQSMVQTG